MIKYLALLFILIADGCASQEKNILSNDNQSMPFRLGFEFQEGSSLCPWAANKNYLKNQPILSIYQNGSNRPLFHVEIDDTDLEFVTMPFNPQERGQLELTMNLILDSLDVLRKELNEKVEISFHEWILLIDLNLRDRGLFIKPNRDLSTLGKIRVSDRFLPKLVNDPSEKAIVPYKQRNWRPMFMPQVTIQHPLEETIPLYFSLFGFDSINISIFVDSLPSLTVYRKILSLNNSELLNRVTSLLRQKISGLIFLHALTFVSLTTDYSENVSSSEQDSLYINQTRKMWEKFQQVDPKIKLPLMSRRPFSEMLKDIGGIEDYPSLFRSMMDNNPLFRSEKFSERFKYVDYGFNIFNQDGASVSLDFSQFENLFNFEFVTNNRENLVYLFHQGVISTTMIRNLRDYLTGNRSVPFNKMFNHYYDLAIQTVQSPMWTYSLDENLILSQKKTNFDVLSPPWFFHPKYSMGAMKSLNPQDLEYGEAVIEVRSISGVTPWFLRKINQPDTVTGDFLKKPENDMVNQALGLFDYLVNFRSPKNIHDITYLGLPYAVLKN